MVLRIIENLDWWNWNWKHPDFILIGGMTAIFHLWFKRRIGFPRSAVEMASTVSVEQDLDRRLGDVEQAGPSLDLGP